MDISTIQKRYNDHNFIYDDISQAFEKANTKILFPITQEVLKDLSKRLSYIFEGMLDEAKQNNLYAVFILYRSLLEHFFKALYIIEKLTDMKSDETAEKY